MDLSEVSASSLVSSKCFFSDVLKLFRLVSVVVGKIRVEVVEYLPIDE
nr:hypothetical protein [Haloferax lucentense]